LLGFKEKECRTIALEVGMQNSGLASGLALLMGGINTIGLAPAVFGPVMNISGSSLATWWHAKAPNEKTTSTNTTTTTNTTFVQN
jgi:BASS family bile acid:Na+ symporter